MSSHPVSLGTLGSRSAQDIQGLPADMTSNLRPSTDQGCLGLWAGPGQCPSLAQEGPFLSQPAWDNQRVLG